MNILHLSNDFSGSTVYMNMFLHLDKLGLTQNIYNPIKEKSRVGKNRIDLLTHGSSIIYSCVLNKSLDRILYRRKINKIVNDIEAKVDLTKIDLIHAHTWFSDGGCAYMLHEKYGTPYVVAIRNTDLNVFYKYLPHERAFGWKILSKASRIILISASYHTRLLKLVANPARFNIASKIEVIPNGVDDFWIKNAKPYRIKEIDGTFNLLYVGKFNRSKNVVALQEAVIKLNREYDINRRGNRFLLHIVGDGGDRMKPVLENIRKYPRIFQYYGPVFEKKKLMEIYEKCHAFTMPSKKETFGLVYVEALLQGLPILYTRGEGIDGFYDDQIGEAVQKSDPEQIKDRLTKIRQDFDKYYIDTDLVSKTHCWSRLAKQYFDLYAECCAGYRN